MYHIVRKLCVTSPIAAYRPFGKAIHGQSGTWKRFFANTNISRMPFITANEHKLHYTDTPPSNDSGNSDAPALILIHGLGSSQNYYFPLLPQLAAYRCITLDTYGSARSRSQGEPLSLEGLCDDFFSLLDELKIQKVVGVGHSMGGTAVCRLAETQPDRVAGVVCIGPVNPKNVVPEMFTKRIDTVIKGTIVFVVEVALLRN